MSKRYIILLLLFIALPSRILNAQTNVELYKQAEDLLEDGNYHKALTLYQDLLRESPNNANLNFKIGYCYLLTATEKVKAVPYLEFAVNHISDTYKMSDPDEQNAPLEAYFYMGKAYHVNYRFDDAERTFFQLKRLVPNDEVEFKQRIDHELQASQIARQFIKSPVDMTVTNLGGGVNSSFAEHSPVLSGDESLLIFTSKREGNTGSGIMDDGQYFEDIYVSTYSGSGYGVAKRISSNINTAGHEASIGLSFDGSKLLIYRDDNGDGNIYVSEREGNDWKVPQILPEVINSKSRETHATFSLDQNEIYFTSDRKGGFGGLDIYRVRKLPNGKWSKAQNLGPTINTEYDEEGPYLHPDGLSLFFASKGHNTMGGFDIFVSYIDENDKWSTPENLGYPINTPDDNIYYVPSVDGRRAFYSSFANNSIGNYDLFRIDLSDAHVRNQVVIAGLARTKEGVKLNDAIITIFDMDDNVVGVYTPEPETGKFLLILPRGKRFVAIIESSNYRKLVYELNVPEDSYNQSGRVVQFNDIISQSKLASKTESKNNTPNAEIIAAPVAEVTLNRNDDQINISSAQNITSLTNTDTLQNSSTEISSSELAAVDYGALPESKAEADLEDQDVSQTSTLNAEDVNEGSTNKQLSKPVKKVSGIIILFAILLVGAIAIYIGKRVKKRYKSIK